MGPFRVLAAPTPQTRMGRQEGGGTPGACLLEPRRAQTAENNPLAPRETPGDSGLRRRPRWGLGDRVSETPALGATSPALSAPSPAPPTSTEPPRGFPNGHPAPREAEDNSQAKPALEPEGMSKTQPLPLGQLVTVNKSLTSLSLSFPCKTAAIMFPGHQGLFRGFA